MIGQITQPYNTGLGNMGWGFASHLPMKSLLVEVKPDMTSFPERFSNSRRTKRVTQEDIDWLLDGIDTLFAMETPYDWSIFEQAKKRGIKTVFMPMFEWLDRSRPELRFIDLFIAPSPSTYRALPFANKVQVPTEVPVDTSKFKQKKVDRLRTLLHNSGHGGQFNRNSTPELIEAMDYVKSGVGLILNSQFQQAAEGRENISYTYGNFENYWEMYTQGDVYILPAKYGVAYLGIGEAMAAGMPVMFTDMEPFNEYLPHDLLIKPKKMESIALVGSQRELYAVHDPKEIAHKIDEVASMDLSYFSARSQEMAYEWSWENQIKTYEKIFDPKH